MSKNRIAYNCQALFVGPSPSSGFHFYGEDGQLNNNYEYSSVNHNLVKKINRVTSLNYSINLPREEYKQIGRSSIASNPIIQSPSVQVDFEYYINGVLNEARMGLNVNHIKPETSDPLYSNFNTFLFSGLSDYGGVRMEKPLGWPNRNRSNRNLFAVVTKADNEDFARRLNDLNENFSRDSNVIAFGDGYLVSYDTSCSVGALPKAKASFICDNVIFYTGSSGLGIPAIHPKTAENFDQVKFVIPDEPEVSGVISVVAPGDIILDISQTGINSSIEMNNLVELGVSFSDIKIQNYSLSIKFNREDLNSIGYRRIANRPINFPVVIDFTFSSLVGEESISDLRDNLIVDKKYNISVYLKDKFRNKTAVRYDIRNASLINYGYDASIEDNRVLNCSFRANASPDNLKEGLFMSGDISTTYSSDYILSNTNEFLIQENGDFMILNSLPLY